MVSADPKAEERLRLLLEQWYEQLDAGETPDPRALCAGDPELMPRFLRLVDQEFQVECLLGEVELPAGETELPFERVGPFRLTSRLGEGGIGRVYAAIQEPLGREVALKLLRPELAADPQARRRFHREAEITAAIDHPNVVPIHAVGEDEGQPWIAMRRLGGPGLDDLPASLSAKEAARIGLHVARALHEAHRHGVVHRDVKPSNVMLDAGKPMLLDFGMARELSGERLTRSNALVGTLLYMSPEQLGGQSSVDARSDIYSLGATLYEAVTGKAPYDARSAESLVREILLKEPAPLRLPPEDRDFETIVLCAMEKERRLRFASAESMAEELERFLAGRPLRIRPSGVLTRGVKLVRRHRRASTIALSLALVVAILGVTLFVRDRKARADFGEDLREANAALERGDLGRTENLLDTLERRRPGNAQAAELRRHLAGRSALEEAFDRAHDLHVQRSPGLLRELYERLESTGDAQRNRPVSDYVRALLLDSLGEHAGAGEALDAAERDFGVGRASRALRALFRGEHFEPETLPLPASGGAEQQADEYVFSALAMRLAGHPAAEQEAELTRADQLDPGNTRALHGMARLLHDRGDATGAYWAFAALSRQEFQRASALASMAREALLLGRLDHAAELLARVEPAERGLNHRTVAAELALRRQDERGGGEQLEAAVEEFPAAPHLRLMLGQRLFNERRHEEAREHLHAGLELDPASDVRERMQFTLLAIDFREIVSGELLTEGEEQQAALGLLADDIRECSFDVEGAETGSDLLLLEAEIIGVLGDRGLQRELTEEAVQLDPGNLAARLALARAVADPFCLEIHADPDGDWDLGVVDREQLAVAREHAAALLEDDGARARTPTRNQVALAAFVDAVLAFLSGDEPGFHERCARYRKELAALPPRERERVVLEALERRLPVQEGDAGR